MAYVARYTHRVAISNNRLLDIDEGKVRFHWKDYRNGTRQKTMTLAADEFIRRFLLHVLPEGFQRIRYYGFLANRYREQKLARCRQLLAMPQPDPPDDHAAGDYRDQYQELTGAAVPRQAESFHIAYCVRLSQRTESMTPTQIAKPLTRSAMRRVIFPVIAGLWGYPVAAAYSLRTSDGLLSVCTDQHEDMKAYCRGYIDAVVEYLVIERLGQKHPVCIPNNVPTTTIENAVINFMKSQSDARSAFSPGLIITMAIDITWPCNSTK